MLNHLFFLIYAMPLHRAILLMAAALLLWTVLNTGLKNYRKQLRYVNLALFLASLAAVFFLTTYRGPVTYAELILEPFHFLEEAKAQPEIYRSMLMNVLLFFPFGLFLPYVLAGGSSDTPEEKQKHYLLRPVKHPVRWALLLALLCSVLVEVIQYSFSLGRAETDDVIMNFLGTALGTLSCVAARKLSFRLS